MTITTTRHEYTRSDLTRINDGEPVTLNLGCGTETHGVGIDINYNPDITHNLNDGIPVEDNAADAVLAIHVLEHLDNPTNFLREVNRVLKPGGELGLEVPNVGWLPVRLWVTQDLQRFWQHKNEDVRGGHWLARRLGNTDPNRTAHRTLWTKTLLSEHLERAGFEYNFSTAHWRRNLAVTAWPTGSRDNGQTLHELEREHGGDLSSGDYWAQTRSRIISHRIDQHNPGTVLDIGCGSGYLTAEIQSRNPETHVIGIDHNEDSIRVANTRDSPAEFLVEDALDLPYMTGAFDCVVLGDVLEHFENPEHVLREAMRVLNAGGTAIVSVPAYRFLYGPHDEHNDHYDRYTTRRLRDLAETVDCRVTYSRYTNLIPLVPYFVYQRLLRRPVPSGTRGEHGRVLQAVKNALIGVEARVPWPAGVTLLAELTHA